MMVIMMIMMLLMMMLMMMGNRMFRHSYQSPSRFVNQKIKGEEEVLDWHRMLRRRVWHTRTHTYVRIDERMAVLSRGSHA